MTVGSIGRIQQHCQNVHGFHSIHAGRLSMIGHRQIPLLVVALTEAYGQPAFPLNFLLPKTKVIQQ